MKGKRCKLCGNYYYGTRNEHLEVCGSITDSDLEKNKFPKSKKLRHKKEN